MSWDYIIQDMNNNMNKSYRVMRNFQKGDRVIPYFKGEFYKGTVLDRLVESGKPYVLVKTDKKVDDEPDALLEGYGLKCPFYPRGGLYFVDEPLPNGSDMYKEIISWPMTKKEIDAANEPLPF